MTSHKLTRSKQVAEATHSAALRCCCCNSAALKQTLSEAVVDCI